VIEVNALSVTVADAFASVQIALTEATSLAPGDLATFEAIFREGELAEARVLSRVVPERPPSAGGKASDDPPASETDRLIHRGVGKALAARSRAIRAVRDFFDRRGFLEVDTPCMVPSPGLDLHLDAFFIAQETGSRRDRLLFLITSPEYQMKRLLVGGIPRCFQLARCFRRGELGSRHNPEFLMLEWYRTFAGMDDVMADTEEIVCAIAREIAGGDSINAGGARVSLARPFERLSVGEAFRRYAGFELNATLAMASADEDRFYRVLIEEVEPALAREPHPVFLVDYPACMASLARKKPDDPRVAERFELYVAGVELCNGFGELTDPGEQRARFERDQAERGRVGKPVYPIDDRFLSALEEGMPPSAGNALGLDRLFALCLGEASIARVLSFPWDWL
jgi:lysyl-tRNA synthetase class 2